MYTHPPQTVSSPSNAELDSYLSQQIDKVMELRREIHAHPELSNQEVNTAAKLIQFMEGLNNPPTIVPNIGGTGFLAIFNFDADNNEPDGASVFTTNQNVKTVVFRSELDAVPVVEKNDFAHSSCTHGVAHKCGHDGHMAILAGLALVLSDFYHPPSGRVVLLFQPAEETGSGAQQMCDDKNEILSEIIQSPNSSIFALHNVPGFPSGAIVLPRGASFASASKGLHIKLQGATSHASQPHLGVNPAMAMCNIIQSLLAMPSLYVPYDQKALVTIVGCCAGEKAFGVSAGDAEVMTTLRATTDSTLKILEDKALSLVAGLAAAYGLTYTTNWEDPFAATINDLESVKIVQKIATETNRNIFWMDEAFPWSEDFGIFLQKIKGVMFGLGMGETHQPLHGEFYDFEDSQIKNGVQMFTNIIQEILD